MTIQIDPQTTIGSVSLTVSSLAQSLSFYQERIGLKLRQRDGDVARLGTTERELLVLHENHNAHPVKARAGLYHFALLVPSRLELAKVLTHLAETRTPLQGLSDHLVSEAIYLADPDGNGIEIYRDRPRAEWRTEDGTLQMDTIALDVESLLAELAHRSSAWHRPGAWSGLDAATVIGHVHLHVANLARDEAFYNSVLGFDLVTRYGTAASFLSAGGYHHHIGMNTWSRTGAIAPPPDATGLRWYTIQLPTPAALQAVVDNIRAMAVSVEERDDGIFLRDPSQNGIFLTLKNEEVI
jgi:catechol 2,3-dioxygenase